MKNKKLWKSILALSGITQSNVAAYLGIAAPTLSDKVNGKKDFTQSEMIKLKDYLHLTMEMVGELFFGEKTA